MHGRKNACPQYRVAGIYRRGAARYFGSGGGLTVPWGVFSMLLSIQQKKHVSLTVRAVRDLMNDTVRSLEHQDREVERRELIRVLQLGLDEIELLWEELQNRSHS